MSGWESSSRETKSFRESSAKAFEASQASGREVSAAIADGQWKMKDTPTQPLMSEEDLRSAIHAAAKNVKPGESLSIALIDHGGPPDKHEDPASATFILYNKGWNYWTGKDVKVSYRRIGEIIKKEIPADVTVKLVSSLCFSGGVHEIAETLPNVCSASSVDFASMTSVFLNLGSSENEIYQLSMWDHLKFNPKSSLQDMHFSAVNVDFDNAGRGMLSSLAYVDKILKEGAFDPKARGDLKIDRKDVTEGQTTPPTTADLEADWFQNPECNCKGLDRLTLQVENIEKTLFVVPLGEQPLELPKEYRAAFAKLKEAWSQSKDALHRGLRSQSEAYAKLPNKDPGAFLKSRAPLDDRLSPEKRFLYFARSFSRFERVAKFLKVATPEQKKIFSRLLKCESEPL